MLQINREDVKLDYYQSLFDLDYNGLTGLKLAHKLTKSHVNPSNNEKMKVKYASQVSPLKKKYVKALLNYFELYWNR